MLLHNTMAARTGRAAEAGPGSTSDRRDGVLEDRRTIDRQASSNRAVFTSMSWSSPPEEGLVPGTIPPDDGFVSRAPPDDSLTAAIPSIESRRARLNARSASRRTTPKAKPLAYELSRHCGSIEILQFLDRVESSSTYLMSRRLTPTHTAIERALRWLVERGLVGCQSAEEFPFKKTYRLTEQGRAVVESPARVWPELFPS